METLAFLVLSFLAVFSAALVVGPWVRNQIVCALALAVNLLSIAGFFLLLHAQFIGFLQVIVYAGAIMVLILFVLMLLNVQDEQALRPSGFFQRILGPLGALALVAIVVTGVRASSAGSSFPAASEGFGTVRELGLELFAHFYYPFEAISLLLVVAMIGAVLLAKRKL
jgi:NADH-quinone oxidoreductase subunit J